MVTCHFVLDIHLNILCGGITKMIMVLFKFHTPLFSTGKFWLSFPSNQNQLAVEILLIPSLNLFVMETMSCTDVQSCHL
jgi:hypothetical protein